MAGAAAAVSKTWHPFPGGVGDLILEYLNLEPLMPPMNLRVSKILRRPIMTLTSPRATLIPTDSDEILRSGADFDVVGMTLHGNRVYRFRGRSALRQFTCHVYIRGPAMDDFREAWEAKYGAPWPYAYGDTHPLLKKLRRRYDEHMEDWDRDNAESLRLMYVLSL